MCLTRGIKRCRRSHTTRHFNIFLLSLCFLGLSSVATRSARSLRTRHSAQPTTLKPDTLQETRISIRGRKGEVSLRGKEKTNRSWITFQICLYSYEDPVVIISVLYWRGAINSQQLCLQTRRKHFSTCMHCLQHVVTTALMKCERKS